MKFMKRYSDIYTGWCWSLYILILKFIYTTLHSSS